MERAINRGASYAYQGNRYCMVYGRDHSRDGQQSVECGVRDEE